MASKIYSIRHSAVLFLVTGLLLLSGLDKIDVNIMEARNFISAREMVNNNEYLLTTLNNEARYEKPPLPTWLTAISGYTLGFDSLFAMRLPVVAITFLLVFAFYFFSRKIGLDSNHSLNNGLILITSFYIFFAGRDNQWDMYTHSFMIVSIYFLWKLFQENTRQFWNSMLSGIFLGFSILSKGPVSFYVLLIPFLISYVIVYKVSVQKKGLYFLIMLFSGIAIGTSWYIYARLKDPGAFGIIATRETANWTNYEVKPFYYYWSFFLQSGLWAIASLTGLIYPYLKSRVSHLKAYRFAVLWTLLSVFLLSVVPEKKVRYLVPVLIPLALTTGFYIEYLIRSFSKEMPKFEKIWIYFSFGIFALIGFAYPFVLGFLLKANLSSSIALLVLSSLLTFTCGFLIVKGLIKKNFTHVFYSMIALFSVIVVFLLPMWKEIIYNPAYSSTGKAQAIGKEYRIQTYSLSEVAPEIVWDFGRSIPFIKRDGDQLVFPEEKQFGLMVDEKDSTIIKTQFAQYQIEKIYIINLYYKNSKKDRLVKDYYILTKKED